MLYKFKSRATADLILLEITGRRLLKILGKEPSAQGIITVAQIPAAIEALEAAVAHEESAEQVPNPEAQANSADDDRDDGDDANSSHVSLRQRATPFIDMLKRSAAEGMDVVWGV